MAKKKASHTQHFIFDLWKLFTVLTYSYMHYSIYLTASTCFVLCTRFEQYLNVANTMSEKKNLCLGVWQNYMQTDFPRY